MKYSKFEEACISGTLDDVKKATPSFRLGKKTKDLIDEVNQDTGETAFHLAVKSPNESQEKVDYFINENGDINKLDNNSYSPIMYAIQSKNHKVFEILLTAIEMRSEGKQASLDEYLAGTLQVAILSGNIKVLKEIVSKYKYLINKPWRNKTPLCAAIERLNNDTNDANDTNLNIISLLDANGAELEDEKHVGESALHEIAKVDTSHSKEHYNLTKCTIQNLFKNHNRNRISYSMSLKEKTTGATALMLAVRMDHSKQVEWFLRYGKDKLNMSCFYICDNFHETVMHKAALADSKILHLLLNIKGLKLYTQNTNGDTPLHLAIRDRKRENIRLLMERYKKDRVSLTDIKNNAGNTILHEIALASDLESLMLISDPKFEKELDTRNENEKTALMISAAQVNKASVDCAKQLIKIKANINTQDNKKRSPLHVASNVDMISLLLVCNQIKINLQDDEKETPLMKAVRNNHESAVSLLLKSSPDYKIKNREGKTAENIADDNEFKTISHMLKKHRMNQFSRNSMKLNKSKTTKQSTNHVSKVLPSAPPDPIQVHQSKSLNQSNFFHDKNVRNKNVRFDLPPPKYKSPK